MLLEIAMGIGFAALYWWGVEQSGLLPVPGLQKPPASALRVTHATLHLSLLSHLILMCLMTVATFIDIDEKTIPDGVTLPGTLIGLTMAALFPYSLLPSETFVVVRPFTLYFTYLHIGSPNNWPPLLDGGLPQFGSLAIGLGCFWCWCFALLPRAWYGRFGFRRALRYFIAKILRDLLSWIVLAVAITGGICITGVWWLAGVWWQGLLTSLVGMVAGAGVVWSVRLVGTAVLKKEAMGFGDVTLMAMIGAFVGWQPSLIIFFLAPLAGLLVGGIGWLLTRENVIPYGPFLCLATACVVVGWSDVWSVFRVKVFALGWLLPIMMLCCLAAMAILLALLQLLKSLFARAR